MACLRDVRLELVRPGPPHNQLLSPLTPYMALCGDGSPVTFHIDLEHRQLLNRLERLRYIAADDEKGFVPVPERLREAQVQELGEEMGRLLARIPSLNTELSRARSEAARSEFVHLRLVLSGSELAILPFELARAPQAFPGEGLDFFLQGNLPVVVSREIRRGRPLPVRWDTQEPKVLFVSAAPAGLTVPDIEHIQALREALEPWIEWPDESLPNASQSIEERRLPFVKSRLRVIGDATIENIYNLCAQESFTHVHILAHGDLYREAGEDRFGVALHRRDDPRQKHVVGGKQLAQALLAEASDGTTRSQPLVVTLAMCDSGTQGSVLVPGGSIAHDLHSEGIPWVFASQFPLTKKGSVEIAKYLYPRLLRGDDPRQVLFELRRKLSMTAGGEHDWASVVTYASVGSDLDTQVSAFFERQTVKAINVQMARADRLVAAMKQPSEASTPEEGERVKNRTIQLVHAILEKVAALLDRWERRLSPGGTLTDRTGRSNCYGMQGSTHKRIGLLQADLGKHREASDALQAAVRAYRRAMDEWVIDDARFNWTASQYLALNAVLTRATPGESRVASALDRDTYAICRRLAERDLENPDRELRAWAHGTLAELELLSSVYNASSPSRDITERVLRHCRSIVSLMGWNSFHAESTRRQFQRYADGWLSPSATNEWQEVAGKAVEALTADTG
jgi:hypothetical protein